MSSPSYRRMHHVLLIALFIVSFSIYGQQAKIKIDFDRKIGEVDPMIYGNFVEHLGRCVYGGIYDPGSPLSDEQGMRKDVLEAIRALKVPVTRYPGGNFVSNYHWLDGVGPKNERPVRMELAWHRLETNQFGTNEFVDFARKVGTEPYIAVNLGTGTIEEAQRWVEYTNVKEGPFYAELRKKHGYPEPYHIKFWGLGNEMDGPWQMGHLNSIDYCKKAKEAAKLMLLTDPGIKLIASGSSNYGSDANPDDWNSTVLHELRDVVDYIGLHLYVGNASNDYYKFMSAPVRLDHRTKIVRGMIQREMQKANRRGKDPIYIAWDEYNVWYRANGGAAVRGTNALEEKYNLEDALVIAGFLNSFIRNADVVKMSNMAQLVNVIAPIFTNEKGLFKQPIFYPLELFANHAHGTSLDAFVSCETYDTDDFLAAPNDPKPKQIHVPILDVSVTYHQGELVICVVNRNKEKAILTEILTQTGEYSGPFQVFEVNGPDIKSENDFGKETVKTTSKSDINAKGNVITYAFPAHSFTLLKGKLKP